MASPTPLPTAVKQRRGTLRADRVSSNEAQPLNKKPSCPEWLGPEAKREWKRIAGHLHDAGLLTYIDRPALAAYCQAWAHWVESEKQLRKEPMVLESEKGGKYLNPLYGVMRGARNDMMAALREFGMTPSSRSKIVVASEKEREVTLEDELFALVGNK